jgi:hypothetical protein
MSSPSATRCPFAHDVQVLSYGEDHLARILTIYIAEPPFACGQKRRVCVLWGRQARQLGGAHEARDGHY